MNLAIVFAVDPDTAQTFSLSREVEDNATKQDIYSYLKMTASLLDDQIDTIMVVKSISDSGLTFNPAPEVVHFWTAGNGDFEGL